MGSQTQLFILMCLAILATSVMSSTASAPQATDDMVPMSVRHENWMAQHGRSYKDDSEKQYRFNIFKQNVEHIESMNRAGDLTYKLGVNKFADLTKEEFKAAYTGFKPSLSGPTKATTQFRYENFKKVPTTVDWRKKGVVTTVKNQHKCGCCWAFSTVAATEAIIKLKTGKSIFLSEQELVDCDTENDGCEGGLLDIAFKFIAKKGLTTEDNYPYMNAQGNCSWSASDRAYKISGYEDVPRNSEDSLMKAVANQPVSVGIDSSNLQLYDSGILTGPCGTEMDHAVTVVGYGTGSNGTKYWLIKNSWGTTWGEKGYAKIERGIKEKEGRCGIAMLPSYPVA